MKLCVCEASSTLTLSSSSFPLNNNDPFLSNKNHRIAFSTAPKTCSLTTTYAKRAAHPGGNEEETDNKPQRNKRVHCELEVLSWRERRIKAEISVSADIDSVWDALTDYERLADFIPNLICSFFF
ncbi:hypothetical protein F3Y22_tig00111644pilonHSYRG00166 [Hibiscus syriacus]|uniref:Coenzyme Q-binding protein COQ10 START domain-containing protein n=1 Tax=Hibiscus syriacus TaxID=106335 RepID=A0A6A2XZ42_HIBSY|nr:hypothetical protein F3Y22_tig00111644pilonHSYRG00166 [Hibiscus syriacus]